MSEVEFIPISVATLMPSSAVGLDLYHTEPSTGRLSLYRGASYPLAAQDLGRLRQRGIKRLFIQKESLCRYQKYLRQVATAAPDDDRIPMQARVAAMGEVVRDVLSQSLVASDTQEAINAAAHLGRIIAQTITSSTFATSDLFRVLHHDYTTFTHSTNVAFYSAILAAQLGFCSQDVEHITAGALLHDIGKLEISEDILCKPGRLTETEYREVKKHPLIGFRRLALRPEWSFGQLMIVYQHHERIDGGGYPVGCAGDEIHVWAKICAVVDVFEALTSHRPYRPPMTTAKALEIVNRDSGKAFDPEVTACWNLIIQSDSNR